MVIRTWTKAFAALACVVCINGSHLFAEEQHDPPVLYLKGSASDRGKILGRQFPNAVRRTIDAILADAAGNGASDADLDLAWKRVAPNLSTDFQQEIAGLAEGSGVPADKLRRAHAWGLRLVGSQVIVSAGRSIGGHLLHLVALERVQPAKGAATLSPLPPPILVVAHAEKEPSRVELVWPGYLGPAIAVNALGISTTVTTLPSGMLGANALGADQCRQIVASATSIDSAVASATPASTRRALVFLGDGRRPDARVVEMADGASTCFGMGDSAEAVEPHSPLPDCLRRGCHLVDPKLSAITADPSDHRLIEKSHERYARWTEWLRSRTAPLGTAQASDALRAIEVDAECRIVLDASAMTLWIDAADGPATSRRAVQGIDLNALMAPAPRVQSTVATKETVQRVHVAPTRRNAEDELPEIYRLSEEPFDAELEPKKVAGGILHANVRFPSPLRTPHPENNTVYGELMRPCGPGPFPCVIVLHIAGGDFELSRFMSATLARSGTAALFVKMPYYGERRPPQGRVRMVSNDLERGLASMRQVVLDLRRTCDWIESDPELDPQRTGILGVSLGAITGSLACAIEPRIGHAGLIMGGARLENILFESVEKDAGQHRALWVEKGGTRESFAEVMRPYDPATYADRLRQRVVLMVSAEEDQTIPKSSTLALWEATGRQPIVWYPCGHYTMARYFVPAMGNAVWFFTHWPDAAKLRRQYPEAVDSDSR